MGDSTAMTIEFLRARLLSERSVSRTARQRAEQLAKRVVELEEHLRIMVIQRRKAEKAAAEVLSILESREMDGFAEVVDSSSDQDDDDGKSKRNNEKEDETSNASRVEKSEVEDGLSGSEPEASPTQGRSLSWKGRSSSPGSHDKQKIKHFTQRHRQSSFISVIEPSRRPNLGKSCRKIKRRDPRSTAEDELDNLTLDEHGERGASWSHHSDEQPECPQEASRNETEEVFPRTSVACSLDDATKETDDNPYTDRRDRDEEMERALEQQAQLIGQYQAEEKAQREWEEKYNENESSTLCLFQPGNQHDSTEPKEETMDLDGKDTSHAVDVPNTEERTAQSSSNVHVPPVLKPHAIDSQKSGTIHKLTPSVLSNGSLLPDLATSGGNGSQAHSDGTQREFAFPAQEKQGHGILSGSGNGITVSPSSGSPSSVTSALTRRQSPSRRLGGVLQALQHAKASLGQLGGIPLSNPGNSVAVSPTDIPIGTTGLFRLPTDSYPQAGLNMPKFYGSGSGSASNYPDVGYGITHSEYPYPTTTYVESRSRVSARYFDPFVSSGSRMSGSSRYSLPYSYLTGERTSSSPEYVRNDLGGGDQYNVYGRGGGDQYNVYGRGGARML